MTGPSYRAAPGVAHVATSEPDGPVVHVASLPDGPVAVLRGSAAVIWEALLTLPTVHVVDAVAEATGADTAEVTAAIGPFTADLEARGLLAPAAPGPDPG